MATYEEHIEGLTKIAIEASNSVPTQGELNLMLQSAVANTVNKIIETRPDEISKFCKTTNSTTTVDKVGRVISVMREHDSTTVLRQCTPIHPSLRYAATEVESLHYRSKYNPGYYELAGTLNTVPAAGSGDNDIVVTQVSYDVGLAYNDGYHLGNVDSFPVEYEYLIGLYAAALACNAKGADIQNNMPVKPTTIGDITLPSVPTLPDVPEAIVLPNFLQLDAELPKLPSYAPVAIDFDLGKVLLALTNEDIEMAEKELELVEKRMDKTSKDKENNVQVYQKELEVFKADLERVSKNLDRKSQVVATEYKSLLEKYTVDIAKYEKESGMLIAKYEKESGITMQDFSSRLQRFQQEIGKYGAEVQEAMTKYKWYQEQAINFMNLYNMGIMGAPQSAPAKEGEG